MAGPGEGMRIGELAREKVVRRAVDLVSVGLVLSISPWATGASAAAPSHVVANVSPRLAMVGSVAGASLAGGASFAALGGHRAVCCSMSRPRRRRPLPQRT